MFLKIRMKEPFLVVVGCLFSAMVDSRGTIKKELSPGLNFKENLLKDLNSAENTFSLNKAVESSGSGSSSASSNDLRRFSRGLGTTAGFNYPTKYTIGTGTLPNYYGLSDLDDADYENIQVDKKGTSYPLGISKSAFSPSLVNGLISQLPGAEKGSTPSKLNQESAAESSVESAKGYKVSEDFDKRENDQVEKSHQAGHHDSKSGSKKGELDSVKKSSESETAVKGEKGSTFEQSEGHKKGHKTSGYHNVYHKDEYKKDTTFYDDEHVSAHEAAFGTEDSRHAEIKGAHEKVEKLDKQFHEDEEAKKGFFTNGHQYGVAQGHDRERSENEFYEKDEEKQKTEASESSHQGF